MEEAIRAPTQGAFSKLLRLLQWTVFVALALFAFAVATEVRKSAAPGAPVTLLYTTVAAAILLALAHLPPIFTRLSRRGKWAAYGAILPTFILFGVYLGQMNPVWERTSEGAKEVAERAEPDRLAAAERARADARLKAEQEARARDEADQKQAALDEQKPELCRTLVDQVVDGQRVLEINNVTVESSYEPNEVLTCRGDAITSQGDVKIEFGIVKTPQGKTLVSTRFP